MAIQTSDNRWSVTNYIVDPTAGKGDFTTISDACAFFLANTITGVTCSIKSGIYTEDVASLAPGITYTALGGAQNEPSVSIVGKVTFTEAGTATIYGCALETNADFAVEVSGSNACTLFLDNCNLLCTDNTGMSFTNSNASSQVSYLNSRGNLITTGIAIFSKSSPGRLVFFKTNMENTGNSTTASTTSAGTLLLQYSTFQSHISASSTASTAVLFSQMSPNVANATCLTLGGSGQQLVQNSNLLSGSAECISMSQPVTLDTVNINSTNTNAINGSSTLTLGVISFSGSSSTINAGISLSYLTSNLGNIRANSINFGGTSLSVYQEGTFTPTLAFGGTSTGITYSVRLGSYTRIGNKVFLNIQINLTSKGTDTGNATITGLPYTVAAGVSPDFPLGTIQDITLSKTTPIAEFTAASTSVLIREYGSASSPVTLTDAAFANTTFLQFSGFYNI